MLYEKDSLVVNVYYNDIIIEIYYHNNLYLENFHVTQINLHMAKLYVCYTFHHVHSFLYKPIFCPSINFLMYTELVKIKFNISPNEGLLVELACYQEPSLAGGNKCGINV